MTLRRDRNTMTALALAAVSLVLAGVLVAEWLWSVRLERDLGKIRKYGAKPPQMALLPEFELPGPDVGFPEMLTRPIFSASRKPPPQAQQVSAMKKGQFTLLGVIITPAARVALLRDVNSGKPERVEQGKAVRGMTVDKVEPDRILLKQGPEVEELYLMVAKSPRPAVQPLPSGRPQLMPGMAPIPGGQPPGVPPPGAQPGIPQPQAGSAPAPAPAAPGRLPAPEPARPFQKPGIVKYPDVIL